MGKGVFSKISEYAQKDEYYRCEEVARSILTLEFLKVLRKSGYVLS